MGCQIIDEYDGKIKEGRVMHLKFKHSGSGKVSPERFHFSKA